VNLPSYDSWEPPIADISAAEQLIDIKSATSLRCWDMAMDGAGKTGKTLEALVSLAMNGLLDRDYPLVNIQKTMEHHHF